MNIIVQRQWFTETSTCGTLSLDGNFECYTLEPPVRETKPYCIPAGTYQVELAMSAKFGFVVPCVLAVPDFTAVEIHIGNTATDTIGCCLVGETHSPDWIGNSRDSFDALMSKLQSAPDDISVTFLGGTEAV